jgi:hypothetical protein
MRPNACVWKPGHLKDVVKTVIMDSKAYDQVLFCECRRQRGMTLLTWPRHSSDHTARRRMMIRIWNRPRYKRLYRERAQTVEPMQGLGEEIFDLERCWMRGHRNNRWLFAATGVAV